MELEEHRRGMNRDGQQTPISRAAELLQKNKSLEARDALEQGAQAGDTASALALGELLLTGRPFGRDLSQSRRWFARAAELGDTHGLQSLIAFTANGTGGEKDWPTALAMLRDHSSIADFQRQIELIEAMDLEQSGDPAGKIERERVAELEGAFRFPAFLTIEECSYLIDTATPLFQPSTVIDRRSGQPVADPIRKSDVAPFPLVSERPLIHAINLRIAAASGTDVSQGEPLQILRYAPGQEYRRHLDAIPATDNQREFTFLIYLNDDYSGGGTVFPEAGLRHRGRTGDAFLFRNMRDDGEPDPQTVHIGEPVTSGTKYLASRWIRTRPLSLAL